MALTPAQTAALAAELNADPAALGYAPLIAAASWAALADKLNDKTLGGNIAKQVVTAAELQECVVASEWAALTPNLTSLWLSVLTAAANGGVPINSARLTSQALLVFTATGAGTTRANLSALKVRAGSRAEALWGDGAAVAAGDCAIALTPGKWTAAITPPQAREMMLYPSVTFTNSVTGETFARQFNGVDITSARLQAIIAQHLDMLETRDASAATFS